MRLLILLVSILLLGCQNTQKTVSQPLPGETTELRLVSWNVRNFFDPHDDPYGDEVPTPEEYQQKVSELGHVLELINGDFVALQEVENLSALNDLNQSLSSPYPHAELVEGNDHGRGIDVAFLSRIPVREVISHADHDLPEHPDVSPGYKFSRDCLEVRLETEPPLIVLITHLKSSRGNEKRSAAKRRVQSEGLVEIVKSIDSEAEAILLMGDFNDVPESWSLEPLFTTLSDPFEGIPAKERATHRFRNEGSPIDHILADKQASERVFNARVWQDIARSTSDHNPVSLQIKLKVSKSVGL